MHEDLYELHVCEDGRWTVAERYTSAEKDEALNDAKQAMFEPTVEAVKVIRETFDANEGLFVERIVFRQIKPKDQVEAAPARAPKQASPKAKPAAPAAKPRPPRERNQTPPRLKSAQSVLAGKLSPVMDDNLPIRWGPILGTGAAVTSAIGAGTLISFSDDIAVLAGGALTTAKLQVISVVLLFAAAMLSFYLWQSSRGPQQADGDKDKSSTPMRPPATVAEIAAAQSNAELVAAAHAASASKDAPVATNASLDLPLDVPVPAEKKEAAKKDEPKGPFDLAVERQRLVAMFQEAQDHVAVRKLTGDGRLDARTRFSCHLFLLGAGTVCFGSAPVDTDKLGRVLETVLSTLGTDAAKALAFAAKLDEYREDPRHRALMRTGADAMRQYVGKSIDPGLALADALRQSGEAQAAAAQQPANIIAIMFTDMVSSVEVTQRLGDEGAMKLVQAHNLIVGTALKRWRGHEVKHTGDGIMAVFPVVADGLSAAMEIQRELAEHNRLTLSMPIRIRIGISAGQPIRERDDFFGTVVQLSSRLCAAATEGEILIGANVQEIVPAQSFSFSERRSLFLKGFPDPQPVLVLDWSASKANAQAVAASLS